MCCNEYFIVNCSSPNKIILGVWTVLFRRVIRPQSVTFRGGIHTGQRREHGEPLPTPLHVTAEAAQTLRRQRAI